MSYLRWLLLLLTCASVAFSSCSGDAVSVATLPEPKYQNAHGIQTHLLGYYELIFDEQAATVSARPNRSTDFTLNAVKFLNADPEGITIHLNGINNEDSMVEYDLDITIAHPINNDKYDACDVRGIFIGNGAGVLEYNNKLNYPVPGINQQLTNADGYSRWFNPSEFIGDGIFSYMAGLHSTMDYEGTSTLNPYKYFGEGLTATGELGDYMASDSENVGVFLHGSGNSRNYVIQFPKPDPGVKFGYAIVANWDGNSSPNNPPHAVEAIACDLIDSSDLYYADATHHGGSIVLDISVYDWWPELSAGIMEDYSIIIESTVLSSPHTLDETEMTPISGGINFYTFHTEIIANNISSQDNNEMWVIVEYPGSDYSNPSGVPNAAEDDAITACFRHPLTMSESCPGWAQTWGNSLTDASLDVAIDSNGDIFTAGYTQVSSGNMDFFLRKYDSCGDLIWSMVWGGPEIDSINRIAVDSFGNIYLAGIFMNTVDFDPGDGTNLHTANSGSRDVFLCCLDLSGEFKWARTWGSPTFDSGKSIAVDGAGNVYVSGYYEGTCNFNPGGEESRTSNGMRDAYLASYDSVGNFRWVNAWGGPEIDGAMSVAANDSGDILTTGHFRGENVDFDPGIGEVIRSSNGERDIFVCKFDSNGIFQWAQTWGAVNYDRGFAIATDPFGNAYITGYFMDTVDFDPGPAVFEITSNNNSRDAFICKFDPSGSFIWAGGWGSAVDMGEVGDHGAGIIVDKFENVYVTGIFRETVDFDPGDGADFHSSNGGWDIYLGKFDSNGDFIWVRTWGGVGDNLTSVMDSGTKVKVQVNGVLYCTGMFSGEVDFAPSDAPCFDTPDIHVADGTKPDVYLTRFLSDGCW